MLRYTPAANLWNEFNKEQLDKHDELQHIRGVNTLYSAIYILYGFTFIKRNLELSLDMLKPKMLMLRYLINHDVQYFPPQLQLADEEKKILLALLE